MEKTSYDQLHDFWMLIWNVIKRYLHVFDGKKIQNVITNPESGFWHELLAFLRKHLMFVPGEGLKITEVVTAGSVFAHQFSSLINLMPADMKFDAVHSEDDFPKDRIDPESVKCFASIWSPGISCTEMLQRCLGTTAQGSYLLDLLVKGDHTHCLQRVALAIMGEGGIILAPGVANYFLVRGKGNKAIVVSVWNVDGVWSMGSSVAPGDRVYLHEGMVFHFANPSQSIVDSCLT